jgi:hypothetical protein
MAAAQAEQDRLALEKRKHIQVGARVTAYERDALADSEAPARGKKGAQDYWWMPYGRFKGRGFRQIHNEAPWYLRSVLPHVKSPTLARNIRRFLSKAGG